ncbi:uncharacterized protein JCM15063_005589 [Sporobolomyces koalae]|uniref:uncharacterized protein n=1 Tax=Sporobolomyces koalae TaxID=500713 RepID=UPI00316DD1FF
MPPNRSKSAKPLRLPGTFASSASPDATPAPPRRATSAKPVASPLSNRTTSTPSTRAARLVATKPSTATTATTTATTSLLSSFGTAPSTTTGSGRLNLDRTKSTPASSADRGSTRLERLGLNRASLRQSSPRRSVDSDADEDEQYEPRRSKTPEPSWARRDSSDVERPPLTSSSARRSSPPRPSPPLAASPPAERDINAPAEAKSTLLGNLWTKAATAWNGAQPAEQPLSREAVSQGPSHSRQGSSEGPERHSNSPKPETSPQRPADTHASSLPLPPKRKPEAIPEPVEPITYHRPPEVHPRNILLASNSSKRIHQDPYDWLGDEPKSPLDPYMFHRQAGRMATKRARAKRPLAQRTVPGMATAAAILGGTAHATVQNPYGTPGSQPPPGGFVDRTPAGLVPVPVHTTTAYHTSQPVHPRPPPVPPPMPSSYKPPIASPVASVQPSNTAPPVAQAGNVPNLDRLQAFPAPEPSRPVPPSVVLPKGQAAGPAPTPVSPSSQARQAYSYSQPPPLMSVMPAPVFTALQTGPPNSIQTGGQGDLFKTALAKKLFGNQLPPSMSGPDTAAIPMIYGSQLIQQPPGGFASPSVSGQMAQSLATGQPSQGQARLPSPAAPVAVPANHGTSTEGTTLNASSTQHYALPPMPIPQSITPPLPALPSPPATAQAATVAGHAAMQIQTAPPLGSDFSPFASQIPVDGGVLASLDVVPPASSPIPTLSLIAADGLPTGSSDSQQDPPPTSKRTSSPSPPLSSSSSLALPPIAALTTPLPSSPAPPQLLSTATSPPRSQRALSAAPTRPSYGHNRGVIPVNENLALRAISPILPPLPPGSPVPLIPPRPPSIAASLSQAPSPAPAAPPQVVLERTPSLAISIETISSPLLEMDEATQIVLQSPTPIELDPVQLASPKETVIIDTDDIAQEEPIRHSPPALAPTLELESVLPTLNFEPLSLPESDPSLDGGSLGLDVGGLDQDQGEARGEIGSLTAGVGQIERDALGMLELPVLREENLAFELDDDQGDESDSMSDQFEAATSFVSEFREVDLERARIDPGHTGRTEKWLVGQGVRLMPGVEALQDKVEQSTQPDSKEQEKNFSAIARPRTAPPSSIPPLSLPTPPLPSLSVPPASLTGPTARRTSKLLSLDSLRLLTIEDDEEGGVPSPVQTMINFDKPFSLLERGRKVASTSSNIPLIQARRSEEEDNREKRQKALILGVDEAYSATGCPAQAYYHWRKDNLVAPDEPHFREFTKSNRRNDPEWAARAAGRDPPVASLKQGRKKWEKFQLPRQYNVVRKVQLRSVLQLKQDRAKPHRALGEELKLSLPADSTGRGAGRHYVWSELVVYPTRCSTAVEIWEWSRQSVLKLEVGTKSYTVCSRIARRPNGRLVPWKKAEQDGFSRYGYNDYNYSGPYKADYDYRGPHAPVRDADPFSNTARQDEPDEPLPHGPYNHSDHQPIPLDYDYRESHAPGSAAYSSSSTARQDEPDEPLPHGPHNHSDHQPIPLDYDYRESHAPGSAAYSSSSTARQGERGEPFAHRYHSHNYLRPYYTEPNHRGPHASDSAANSFSNTPQHTGNNAQISLVPQEAFTHSRRPTARTAGSLSDATIASRPENRGLGIPSLPNSDVLSSLPLPPQENRPQNVVRRWSPPPPPFIRPNAKPFGRAPSEMTAQPLVDETPPVVRKWQPPPPPVIRPDAQHEQRSSGPGKPRHIRRTSRPPPSPSEYRPRSGQQPNGSRGGFRRSPYSLGHRQRLIYGQDSARGGVARQF